MDTPTMAALKSWIDQQLAEEAGYTEDEEPDVIIALLELLEAYFEKRAERTQ